MNLTMIDTAFAARRWLPSAALIAAVALVGCGDKRDLTIQVAARVNKDAITVPQVNFVLQQQRGLQQNQVEVASRQILERLIDQDLALQQGEDQKIDRDPRVVQQLEAARREIIARAYLEKVGEAAVKPTPEEIQKYYSDNPALFSERRIYSLQEIAIEAKPDQVAGLKDQLAASKNINDFVEFLKSHDYRFAGSQAVRAAEQLPLNSLTAFARMKDGQAMVVPANNGVQVVVLAGSRSQPVTAEQARPAIEQFLLNDRKRKLVEEKLKALRASAKIEYMGKFAAAPASAPTVGAAPAPESAPDAGLPASSGPTGGDSGKGMGLK